MSSVLPFVVNGVSLGLGIALVALAMALIWRTVGFVDFGLGAVYLITAYAVIVLVKHGGWPLALAIPAAALVGAGAAVALYWAVYRVFLRRGAPLFVRVLVGLCLFTAAQNLISAGFSPEKHYVVDSLLPGFELLGTRLNVAQLAKMGVGLVGLAGVALFCLGAGPGRTILAVADNKRLAQGVGISVDRAYTLTYALAGLLTAAAAIPDIAESGVDPYVAINPLFLALAAIIIGGLSPFRAPVLGGLLLGLAFHLAVWFLPASWQEVIAYGFVLIVLMARPEGLFGGLNLVRERA